jgi:hypothetical protein
LHSHFCGAPPVDFAVSQTLSAQAGYFEFGPGNVLFGRCAADAAAPAPGQHYRDVRAAVQSEGAAVRLPFDPAEVLANLREERYWRATGKPGPPDGVFLRLYYKVRPLLGVRIRKHLQRLYLRGWEDIPFPRWPVDFSAENLLETVLALSLKAAGVSRIPMIWFWPNGAPSATIVTHDVETAAGRDFCSGLMDLNDSFGIPSSFQIVPEERYAVPRGLIDTIRTRGHEVNVQDLNHDGLLYHNHPEFLRRAAKINQYGREFAAAGFRAAVLYRNPDWYGAFAFAYDMSIPNVAHLDPQRGGCCTVFPYFIGGLLELPVTLIQDYSLFHILRQYSTDLWQRQISLIRARHGLISVIVHPDYILTERPRRVYADLLRHLTDLRARGETWLALPGEVNAWWRQRSQMTLEPDGESWRITGPGSERARLAWACLGEGETIRYELASGN